MEENPGMAHKIILNKLLSGLREIMSKTLIVELS